MLETTWFVLWGLLWAIYFMLDGFDLGASTLMPFLARSETDRRLIYRSMGPFWDGNEVWLITAGGVTFAAFPTAYAVMFSSFYSPLMLLLLALILRGAAFELRSKVDCDRWRRLWDRCLVAGSAGAALLLGVFFANIFKGIPIDGEGVFQGSLVTLLNPYGLLGGLLFALLFLVHGALWLAARTEGDLRDRAATAAKRLWPVLTGVAVVFLVTTWFASDLWANYLAAPALLLLPLLAVAALVLTRVLIGRAAWWRSWFASGATIAACTLFGVAGLFPNLLPSSLDGAFSLTVHNASSSPLTLKIMLGVALVMVPVVIAYQTWVYVIFRHRVTAAELANEEA